MTNDIKCAICGEVNQTIYVSLDGKHLCYDCWHEKFPYCKSCGIRLSPDMNITYFKNQSGTSLPYCERCAHNPICICCRMPIQTGHKKISDGDVYCSECYSAMLADDPSRVSEAWDSVCNFLLRNFNYHTRSPLPKLVTRTEFRQLTGIQNLNLEAGFYFYRDAAKSSSFSMGKRQNKFMECQIYLLRGLSSEQAEETLAHEAGHDFLDSMLPMFYEGIYSEGFAQYIASGYNTSRGRFSRNELIFSSSDPIYGNGARLVRDIVAQTGFDGLMNILRGRYHG